jgi:hypothetical protein
MKPTMTMKPTLQHPLAPTPEIADAIKRTLMQVTINPRIVSG